MSQYYPGPFTVYPSDTIYFITLRVIDWVDVFTRDEYKSIVTDSLEYCRKNKGLLLFAWVLMTNHIHLIAAHETDSDHLWQILGDFKKYTAKRVIHAILNNPQESRKYWMLNHFMEDNILKNEEASCSVSKHVMADSELDHTAYDCFHCNSYSKECDICKAEMRNCRKQVYGDDNDSTHYHLWQRGIDKYCIYNIRHMRQKLDYLHANPVKAGIVSKPWDYLYSSCRDYAGEKGLVGIDHIDLGLDNPLKPVKW